MWLKQPWVMGTLPLAPGSVQDMLPFAFPVKLCLALLLRVPAPALLSPWDMFPVLLADSFLFILGVSAPLVVAYGRILDSLPIPLTAQHTCIKSKSPLPPPSMCLIETCVISA